MEDIVSIIKSFPNNKASLEQIENKLTSSRGLKKELEELCKQGIIYKTSNDEYIVTSFYNLYPAIVTKAYKDGIEATNLNDPSTKYFIDSYHSGEALYNDTILVGFNRSQAFLKDIINKNNNLIVGEVFKGRFHKYIKPININYPLIDIDKGEVGSLVAVKVVSRFPNLKGEVKEVISTSITLESKIKGMVVENQVDLNFDDETIDESNQLLDFNINDDLEGRVDHTKDLVVTIDGIDTKDMDDAISVTKINDELYNLKVHIADVSHYVKRYSKLDQEALKRGCSIYLVNSVIPMLPKVLSNDLCSLNPNTTKLTLTCSMDINLNGEVVNYDIYESYIESKYRLNYDDVNKFIDGKLNYPLELGTLINNCLELSKILKENKNNRGEIDLDINEPKLILDDFGKVKDIKLGVRGNAERIIEDFMVIANETVASHIYYLDLPMIYRIHDKPSLNKIEDFETQVKDFGYSFNAGNEIYPITYQKFMNKIKNDKFKDIIKILMLRSMSKAKYSNNNIGHFGLASTCYTHFTSPIRRYPDLLVHRLLKMYIHQEQYNYDKLVSDIKMIADLSSNNEIRAIELERKAIDMKIAEYMKKHINEEYEATITSITNFGFFVELNNKVEGLVHFNSMKDDFYSLDIKNNMIVGSVSNKIYKLGDNVKVRLTDVNLDNGDINFLVI